MDELFSSLATQSSRPRVTQEDIFEGRNVEKVSIQLGTETKVVTITEQLSGKIFFDLVFRLGDKSSYVGLEIDQDADSSILHLIYDGTARPQYATPADFIDAMELEIEGLETLKALVDQGVLGEKYPLTSRFLLDSETKVLLDMAKSSPLAQSKLNSDGSELVNITKDDMGPLITQMVAFLRQQIDRAQKIATRWDKRQGSK